MEGGIYPWKTQTISNDCPEIDYFTNSLPSPPNGMIWKKNNENQWVLESIPEIQSSTQNVNNEDPYAGTFYSSQARKKLLSIKPKQPIEIMDNKNELILKFSQNTQEDSISSKIYLEDANWDLSKAMQKWKDDNSWEQDNIQNNKALFTTEIPSEDIIAPISIEIAKIVIPRDIKYELSDIKNTISEIDSETPLLQST